MDHLSQIRLLLIMLLPLLPSLQSIRILSRPTPLQKPYVLMVLLTERIDSLKKLLLVGKWQFPEMEDQDMRKWLSGKWAPLIGYTPIISRLMKDWYSFHFLKESDVEIIFKNPWVYGRSFLALSRWYAGFDPLKNTPSNCLIWVKLPNLPLELWTEESLAKIGNSIGRFIYVDPWCRGETDKRVAWVLIEKPYKGVYPDLLEIAWEDSKIIQRLDFWGIPFRCSFCHKTGPLIRNCSRRLHHKNRKSNISRARHSESDCSQEAGIRSSAMHQQPQIKGKISQSSDPSSVPDPFCSFRDSQARTDSGTSLIPEPREDSPVPPPPEMNKSDFVIGSLPIQISSSSTYFSKL